MSAEENKALLRRAVDEFYNQRNLDIIDEVFVDDVIAHEPDRDLRGTEEVKQYSAAYLDAFPDQSATVEDVIAEDDKVVLRYTFRGTHQGETEELGPPTGRQFEVEGITLYRFEGDKVVEAWDRFDNLSFLQQLGLAPEQ
jgi:steroid delta-isomerase-like uncharacterized protein